MMQEHDLADEDLDDDLDYSDDDQENQDDDLGDQNLDDDQNDDEEELIISIGGEAPTPKDVDDFNGQPAPDWVKQMRKENRELKRQLKTAPSTQQEQAKQEITLGKKPTLEDHDYDAEKLAITRLPTLLKSSPIASPAAQSVFSVACAVVFSNAKPSPASIRFMAVWLKTSPYSQSVFGM